ncbi:MAG: glycosyltransferase family 2 protein [Bacteroidetes bacterium]|nr:glycosyltransferase family 2 protein [Bacteroidota bacterium]
MTSFSIIILNWNGLDHLKNYLSSVVNTNYQNFEVILADNGSTDASIEWVEKEYPSVKIAALDNNYFFAGGNNRAIQWADNDWLVFLNNDVEVAPDWLTKMAAMIDKHASVGILQPKIRSLNQPTHFEYAGAAGGFIDRYGYPYCRGRILNIVEEDLGQYDDPTLLDWASGAAMFTRKDLFEQLEGFDEDFEMHMEEIDLCWRARNMGIQIMYCPESIVFHLGGGSLTEGSYKKIWYNYRNNWFMLLKNIPTHQLLGTLGLRYVLDIIAGIKAMLSGQFHEAKAILSAHLSLLAKFPKLLVKRKIQESIIHRNKGQRKQLGAPFLVWEFFILSRKTYSELSTNQTN